MMDQDLVSATACGLTVEAKFEDNLEQPLLGNEANHLSTATSSKTNQPDGILFDRTTDATSGMRKREAERNGENRLNDDENEMSPLVKQLISDLETTSWGLFSFGLAAYLDGMLKIFSELISRNYYFGPHDTYQHYVVSDISEMIYWILVPCVVVTFARFVLLVSKLRKEKPDWFPRSRQVMRWRVPRVSDITATRTDLHGVFNYIFPAVSSSLPNLQNEANEEKSEEFPGREKLQDPQKNQLQIV